MKKSNSLLPELLQLFPELRAQIYFKTTLTAISHAMEDLVLASTEQPLIIANFQQERYYRQESARYQRIAQRTDRVYVLAAPETDFASAPAPFATVGLEQSDELAQEWHLAIVGENYSACLICREYAAPVGTIDLDSARQFRGFWTFDPAITRQAAALLLQRISDYRPDLASQIDREKQRAIAEKPPLQSAESLSAELFINRLVTYLQASQHRQVKAYQRIVGQERQERLINQFSTAIRQTQTIEDILAVTIREVSQSFGQSRCLLSRLPLGVTALTATEYLASHPHFQPLLNQGQIVSIADVSQDSGIQSHPDLQIRLAQAQIEACLLVPIFISATAHNDYRQQCLGVLELHHSSPYLWSIADRDLLRSIAECVGIELLQAEALIDLKQMNQQLAAIKQTQNNLIAIVGHELRTPLSTIQVCLESLDAEPDMPAKYQQSMVGIALTDSERLRKLIEDFLLLSRLESNLSTWQMEPVNVTDSISIAVSNLQAAAQPRELPSIVMDLSPTLPLIIADNEALFQLFSKLLDNACKFTPSTGTITLKIGEVATAQMPPQSMLKVEIADTGCGIEPDRLETIFDRFHQEEGFLRRAVGGAGLGLSICRQLVRQLGGQIWATSLGKGQGSQFYVTLPVLVN